MIITELFNLGKQHGTYTDALKCAMVIPVYKNGDDSLLQNYRPIFILSLIAKILQKLIYQRLHNYIFMNRIFSPNQLGFTSHRAIVLSSINALNYYANKTFIIRAFLDFRKAFDTVDQDL